VKKSAKVMVEKFYSRLTTDFQLNKRVTQEFALMPSKRMRNKVAVRLRSARFSFTSLAR